MKHFKKIIPIILLSIASIAINSPKASAATQNKNHNYFDATITYDSFGGYYVESFVDSVTKPILQNYATTSTTQILKKTKSVKYYASNNTLRWTYYLTASFNVRPGISSNYRTSSADVAIYNNSWSFVSEKHSGSGTIATGTIIMSNGANLSKTITIECDKYGNFK